MSQLDFLNDLNLKFSFGPDLREVPECPSDVDKAIEKLKSQISIAQDEISRVKLLGSLGSYCRTSYKLDEAHSHFQQALDIIKTNNLSPKFEIANQIRLAHTLQWKRLFKKSNSLFEEIVERCERDTSLGDYLDFAYQHSGKNYFDQRNYKQALRFFYRALLIRNKKDDLSLTDSTLMAIESTKEVAFSQIGAETEKKLLAYGPPVFIKNFLGKNHVQDGKRSNCINAALNCFKSTEKFEFTPVKPLDFILHLKADYDQLEDNSDLKMGDLVIAWNRTKGSWEDRKINVSEIDPDDSDFPYGLIFDHVAFYVRDRIVFNKPNPCPLTKYKFDYLETSLIPAKLGKGFEVTFHRKK